MSLVPFLNLGLELETRVDLENGIKTILADGNFLAGKHNEEFESSFSNFAGMKYCKAVGNGLDALTFALLALDLPEGSEVIVPAHTFIATWLAVYRSSLKIVPVDINKVDYKMDLTQLENAINLNTAAILPVHLYGEIEDLPSILEIVGDRDIHIVEDCAQAHGSNLKINYKSNQENRICCWSFYPGKTLGGLGDGGAVTTNNLELASKIERLRNYGSVSKYNHEIKGFNSRLDEINALFLQNKLNCFDKEICHRNKIRDIYHKTLNFQNFKCKLSFSNDVVNHLFIIETPFRDDLSIFLKDKGIETLIHYPVPPHRQLAFSDEFSNYQYPNTNKVCGSLLSLPFGSHMSEEQALYVAESVNKYFG